MTRDELVDLLEVERHQPLPPSPPPAGFIDTPELQAERRAVLGPEPTDYDLKHQIPIDDIHWERRGLIYIARDHNDNAGAA